MFFFFEKQKLKWSELTYCNIKRPKYVDVDTTKFVKKIVSI